MPPPLRPEVLARTRERYERDKRSIGEIAKEENLSTTTVARRLRLAGTKMRASREGKILSNKAKYRTLPTPEVRAEVRRLYAAGESADDIGAVLGRSRSLVRRWLIEDGVTMRSVEERGRKRSGPSPTVLAYVARRSREGATASELAEEMLKPERAVRYWLSLVDAVVQASEGGGTSE